MNIFRGILCRIYVGDCIVVFSYAKLVEVMLLEELVLPAVHGLMRVRKLQIIQVFKKSSIKLSIYFRM